MNDRPARRRWAESRWDLWARVYDPLVGLLGRGRRVAVALADPRPGERILLPGAGTGLDLLLLPAGVRVIAVEQSPVMIRQLRRRADRTAPEVEILQADAAHTGLPPASVDCVMLHLILAVATDPAAILREAVRVLVPGGRIVVFDKFAPEGRTVSAGRRWLNRIARPLATDVTLQLEPLATEAGLAIVAQTDAGMRGLFRAAVLNRIQD